MVEGGGMVGCEVGYKVESWDEEGENKEGEEGDG